MSTPLEVKLFSAASADSALTALLGSSPFRWYNVQLTEGSAYPAITVHRISGAPLYAADGRNTLALYRMQVTIWEGQTPDTSDSVLSALRSFLDSFSATGVPSQTENRIVNVMRALYAETQPAIFQTVVDVMIRSSDAT